jgi:hypothetical protein
MRAFGYGVCLVMGMLTGCSFHARDADSYRQATRELLETRNPDIKGCYDAELKQNPTVSGTVIVKFNVQKQSGKLVNVAVDEAASSAPPSLRECVVKAIDGLALDPPDEREGDATFQWEFQIQS